MSSEWIIGIDLGTTNSEAAVYRNGRPEILPDEEGRLILPSWVGVTEEGAILVGEAARNQYAAFPERTVRSIKRRMGESAKVAMGGKEYSPQEISAMILRRLKTIAEARLGEPLARAVITVPAYFSDAQRQATREAGRIAGLEVMRIVNEPTAAALVYEAGHQRAGRILVYDLGGGTFDVSVVRLEEGVVEVISSHGDNHLGGDDFDQRIVNHLLDQLQSQGVASSAMTTRVMARLSRAAETAKIQLTDHPFVRIEEEHLLTWKGQPVHLAVELSREGYEGMIGPLIEGTLAAVHTALQGAGLTARDIGSVLLVGGAARTPLVRRRLEEIFGFPPRGEVNPELCVALGAAIQAAALQGSPVSAVLVDITPYTFGTSALGELDGEWTPDFFVPVIRKNTPIPVSKSEVFFTVEDNQELVEVRIFQGEHRDALRNRLIGEFTIEGLSRGSAHQPVVLRMDLDRDGILHVTATEKNSGLAKRIRIAHALDKLEEADMDLSRRRLDELFGAAGGNEEEASQTRQRRVQALALVEKAERLLESAAPEDREEMIDLMEAIRDGLDAENGSAVEESCQALSEILFYLET
ncbi:MAG: Hsp70 family protein [Magnetococcales bacterium]|nr:Hsp70 family protein [Magnetococcales bacterium]